MKITFLGTAAANGYPAATAAQHGCKAADDGLMM